MKVSAHDSIRQPFVLTVAEVSRIWDLLEGQVGPTEAHAACADGIDRTFSNYDALASYENSPPRAIQSVRFTARSPLDPGHHAVISFGEDFGRSIGLWLEGPELKVSHLRTVLRDLCEGIRPWYAWITRVDGFYLVWGVLSFGYLVLDLMVGERGPRHSRTGREAIVIVLSLVAAIGLLGTIIWGLNRLRSLYFPIATFALGQGMGRYELYEKVRWGILVGFVVSLAATLLGAILI